MINTSLSESTFHMEPSGGASKSPGADIVLHEKVTSVACEVLRVYRALWEFRDLYNDHTLPSGFNENHHEYTPHFEKMQQGFNSLKGKVTLLKATNPDLNNLFELMLQVHKDGQGIHLIESALDALIGKDNMVDTQEFSIHGIICIKDELAFTSQPLNLITKSQLEEIKNLKMALLNPITGVVTIEGDVTFKRQIESDLDKLLTFPEGRLLFKNIVEKKVPLTIASSEKTEWWGTNIFMNNHPGVVWGYSASKGIPSGVISPNYIILAHELIHFSHYINEGILQPVPFPEEALWSNVEEYRTIGDPRCPLNTLSENSFLSKTFHLQRIYHAGPGVRTFAEYLQQIKEQDFELTINYTLDEADYSLAIEMIKESGEATVKSLRLLIDRISPIVWNDLAPEIFPIFTKKPHLMNKEICEMILIRASEVGDLDSVIKLFEDFSEFISKLEPAEKLNLITRSFININVTKTLVENNFHLGIVDIIINILYYLPKTDHSFGVLKNITDNKALFNLTDEQLRPFREDTNLHPVVRALFDESEEKEIQPLD